jgi:hypothetical protein
MSEILKKDNSTVQYGLCCMKSCLAGESCSVDTRGYTLYRDFFVIYIFRTRIIMDHPSLSEVPGPRRPPSMCLPHVWKRARQPAPFASFLALLDSLA